MFEQDPIGTVAFFRERQRVESRATGKVLHAMTQDMVAFRAHEASSTQGVIAWTIVRCLRICNQLHRNSMAQVLRDAPPPLEELLRAYDDAANEMSISLLAMTQKDWESERTVMAGSRVLLRQPLGQIFWLFHVDSIHHRGQLSVFLRPFGAKVPSIYGPSGDCASEPLTDRKGEAHEA